MTRIFAVFLALIIASLPAFAPAIADPFGGAAMMTTYAAPGLCSYTPPLDATTAKVAYSFRLLRTAYSGGNIVTIKRSSDNTTKTFTATTTNCTINQSDAFFDNSTYTITTWYDQSGNAKNLTATNAPTITLNCQNGQPCVVFASASSQYLSVNTALTITDDTFAAVGKFTDNTASHFLITQSDGGGNNLTGLFYSSTTSSCKSRRDSSGTTQDGVQTCTNNVWHRFIATQTGTLSSIYVDGAVGTDNTTSQATVSAGWTCVGCTAPNSAPATFMQGDISEVIVFPNLSSTVSGTVSTNQSSFWNIP